MTNLERIRNMDVSELAQAINNPCSCCIHCARDDNGNTILYEEDCLNNCCYDGIKAWLESNTVSLDKESKLPPIPNIEPIFRPIS